MSTALSFAYGQSTAFLNIPVNVASVTGEATIILTVTKGYPIDVSFVGTNAWIFRATTSVTTNDMPVAAGQPLVLRFSQTTTFYILRQAADGVVTITPLAVNEAIP